MTWFPPLAKAGEIEEYDSIADVFEECDALELEVAKLKDKLAIAEWALKIYAEEDNKASDALDRIRNG